jgi:hypothetical protein
MPGRTFPRLNYIDLAQNLYPKLNSYGVIDARKMSDCGSKYYTLCSVMQVHSFADT